MTFPAFLTLPGSTLAALTLTGFAAAGLPSCGAADLTHAAGEAGSWNQAEKSSNPGSDVRPARGIWIDREELAELPASGPAWRQVLEVASASTEKPNLSDQEDPANTRALAKALVFVRTGKKRYRDEVVAACEAAMGTEKGGNTLALGRNLGGFVLAADLVGLPPELDGRFKEWLRGVVLEKLDGRTIRSTHEDRPNNWGTHAGASRIAAALYLGDREELDRAAAVFRGWLGDRDAYAGFKYRALDWQADPKKPVGINAAGSRLEGHSVDGVLPDDQRRGGGFSWPPPKENYVYEALQGALVQAMLLERAGFDPWSWSDRALLRAYRWLHDEADYPATGDDVWQIHVVNRVYGTDFPAAETARAGKNVGFTAWTHASPAKPR
ncbi:Alginate lyase [Planctomycetes bacterium Poly30]|uniref:Alginate lyase n=1 Tax=Saltatorellus ferox TaxID=2528018 RepID=A0A518ESN7_9BACT|nr:Alginate lyase [Planctomycetes bacterium Poly30]